MIVSKATSVYAIMVVVLVGGLWMILAIGNTLTPPTDLAGKWELSGADGSQAAAQDLSVEQSGKFVDMTMGQWTGSLKIETSDAQKADGGIRVAGKGQTVTFDGLGANDRCTIRFDGPISGTYQAHRIVRAFR
jgi:hypothetical protein